VNLGLAVGLAVAGYLIGAVSFARIVGRRIAPGEDLSKNTLNLPGDATIEYGGVSATSIAIRGGPKWGSFTGLLDMAKAFVPTLVVRLIWPDESYHLVVAVGTIVGHNYPVYYRFEGGRGQTPIYGSLLAIDWIAVPITTIVGVVVGVGLLRDMFIAYTLGMWLLIPWFAWRAGPPEVAYAVMANVLFMVAMIPETREYLAKRKAGELEQVTSWRDFKSAHPAMRGERRPRT
jgi:glycerol-3-phosphate acyltransferase PlsY